MRLVGWCVLKVGHGQSGELRWGEVITWKKRTGTVLDLDTPWRSVASKRTKLMFSLAICCLICSMAEVNLTFPKFSTMSFPLSVEKSLKYLQKHRTTIGEFDSNHKYPISEKRSDKPPSGVRTTLVKPESKPVPFVCRPIAFDLTGQKC